jgi:hypothetical protein
MPDGNNLIPLPPPRIPYCEIRLRAERKAGELLRQMEKAKGGNPNLSHRPTGSTLSDLGITRDQSSQWQRLAAVPEPEFEAALAGSDKPTTNGIITAAFPPKPKPVSGDALWLWGRLEEFKRQALDKDPVRFLETLTPAMHADVCDLVPRVIGWLEQMRQQCQKSDR